MRPLSQKVTKNVFWSKSLPKIFLIENQPDDIVFDIRNEYHSNRMEFGDLEKIFLVNFDLFRPTWSKK